MRRIAEYFKNRISLWLLPLMLTTTAASVLIECYAQQYKTPFTVGFFLLALLTFMLLDGLMRIRIFGGLLYTVMLIGVVMLALRSIFTAEYFGGASVTFQQWFYGTFAADQPIEMSYFLALYLAGGFFLNSVLFYFTQVQYRALGTLLIIFIPFVIYAKRQDVISDLTVTVMITLFIAIIVHNRIFLAADNGKGTVVNIAYVLSVALFVSVTGALAMIFPDLSTESKLEKDASFLNFQNINAGNAKTLDNPDSSTRFHGAEYTNEPIFYVYPENMSDIEYPIYFRRRSMNAYDAQRLDWYVSSDLKGVNSLNGTLYMAFQRLYEAEEYKGRQGLLGIPANAFEGNSYEYSTANIEIEFESGLAGISYIPAPLYSSVEFSYDAPGNMAYSDMFYLYPEQSANTLGRVKEEIAITKEDAEDFAVKAGGTFSDFYDDMQNAYTQDRASLNDENGDLKEDKHFESYISSLYELYFGSLVQFYRYSPDYLKENGLKDYDRIKELADEIVKDCTSDYEKAKAIEEYFTTAGFTYDLDYIPEDESVSYFLFESQTGICIDFASAMGVMCIMEGLPVRYVEGFIAYERDEEDPTRLIVRDSNAHAFIEVFIPYVGWMTFDPTVEGYMADFSEMTQQVKENMFAVFMRYLGRILLVLGVLFVMIFIVFFDRIWEFFFRLTLKLYEPEKQLMKLHRHIFRVLEYEDKTNLSPYTSRLLNDYIRKKTGESLSEVTTLFEEHRFGGRSINAEQFEKAYSAYKALYPRLRKKAPQIAAKG